MRIYEIVSNQNIANEQILTEIDWKKLRNALIGGAMSLAVLGAPGKAIAQSLDANKITPDQAIELIQKKVASGEIDPRDLQNLKKLEVPKPPTFTQAEKETEAEKLKKIIKPGSTKPTIAQKEPYDYYGPGPRYKLDNLPVTVDGQGSIMSGPLSGVGLGSSLHPLAQHFNNTKDQWSQPQYSRDKNPNGAYMQWRLENDKVDIKSTPTVKKDEPKKTEPVVKKDEPKKVEPTVKQDDPVVKKDEPKKTITGKLDPAQKKFIDYAEKAPYKIVRVLKKTLYDADSAQFRNWEMKAVDDGSGGTYLVITGEINGKNKLGGYVGFKPFYAMIDPDTGEVDKTYLSSDPKYPTVVALLSTMKTKATMPLLGPKS